MKSNDILKETSKNSYFIKYMEECNKSKINHRKSNNNNSLRQSKTNYDPKENNISNSNQTNCSLTIHKKSKNNSVIKKTNNYSNKFNIHKKLTRTLSSIINPENSYKLYKDNNNKSSYISKSNNSFIKLKSNRKIFDKEVVLNNSLTTINENVNIMPYTETNPGVFNIILFEMTATLRKDDFFKKYFEIKRSNKQKTNVRNK